MSEIGLFEAIHSARAIRHFRPDPVPRELITKILDAAIQAPSAGNNQNWLFVVVTDAEQRTSGCCTEQEGQKHDGQCQNTALTVWREKLNFHCTASVTFPLA